MTLPGNQKRIPDQDIDAFRTHARDFYTGGNPPISAWDDSYRRFVSYVMSGPYDNHKDELLAEIKANMR